MAKKKSGKGKKAGKSPKRTKESRPSSPTRPSSPREMDAGNKYREWGRTIWGVRSGLGLLAGARFHSHVPCSHCSISLHVRTEQAMSLAMEKEAVLEARAAARAPGGEIGLESYRASREAGLTRAREVTQKRLVEEGSMHIPALLWSPRATRNPALTRPVAPRHLTDEELAGEDMSVEAIVDGMVADGSLCAMNNASGYGTPMAGAMPTAWPAAERRRPESPRAYTLPY